MLVRFSRTGMGIANIWVTVKNPIKTLLSASSGPSPYAIVQSVLIGLCGLMLSGTAFANPIIHEIYYDGLEDAQRIEFVELRNTSGSTIKLSDWFFDKGISMTFPVGASIPANGYVIAAQNESDFITAFGGNAAQIYQWDSGSSLANSGETIRLRKADGTVADAMKYDVAGEWPVTGIKGRSIQLISTALDNDNAGAWRAATPTPLKYNSAIGASLNNLIVYDSVKHSPKRPTSSDAVTISIKVPREVDGMKAKLQYQVVRPGNYVALSDAGYQTWGSVDMSPVTNGVWGVTLPAAQLSHRQLVRYRVRLSTADDSATLMVPPPENPSPNFAFFVYDGLGSYGSTSFDTVESVPVYHLIAKATDVSSYIDNGTTTLWPVTGTLVFDGEVYDHVRYRSKGRGQRHDRIKHNIKFKANKGQKIAHFDDHGNKLQDKGNFMIYGGTLAGAEGAGLGRADSGLSEGVALKQFDLFGAHSAGADWMHFRVIDSADENPAGNPAAGDFWGIYNIVSDYSGDWLQDHDLPQSYLYEWKDFGVSEFPPDGPFDINNNPAYNSIKQAGNYYPASISVNQNVFDLDIQYRFMAANQGLMQQERAYWGKHYHKMYHHPDRGWFLMPSDMDYTMLKTTEEGQDIFLTALRNADKLAWEGIAREYLDLLLNDDGVNNLIDEKASLVHTPQAAVSLAHLDRDRWGLRSYYTDFDNAKSSLKNYFTQRSDWMENSLINDSNIPWTPSVTIANSNPPADGVLLTASTYSDPNGTSFRAMEWIVAEYTDPNNPPPVGKSWHYEAKPTWRSGVLTAYNRNLTVPQGVVQAGKLYRARVRYQDNTLRWGKWGNPAQFLAASPASTPGSALVINEIHYNPATPEGINDDELEFIELWNTGSTQIKLDGYRFTDGIDYTFPVGVMAADSFLVLASDAEEFERRYGFAPYGEYDKSLNNGGEGLRLKDAWGTIIDQVKFGDGNRWGPGADGYGPSLELMDPQLDNEDGASWLSIGPSGGTPGAPNSVVCNGQAITPDIQFNEINYDSAANADSGDWIEIRNNSDATVNLQGWRIADGFNSFTFPSTTLAPGAHLVVVEDQALFNAAHPGVPRHGPLGFSLSNGGEPLILLSTSGCLADLVIYDDDMPWETLADGNGATLALSDPSFDNAEPWAWQAGVNGGTPAAANGLTPCTPGPSDVMINELNVDSDQANDPGDWIEIFNPGPTLANLSGYRLYDDSSRFRLPPNTYLGVGEYLILAEDPFAFSAIHPGLKVQVINGQGFTLNNKGERLMLTTENGCPVDTVTYDNQAPWPIGLGTGQTLSFEAAIGADNGTASGWHLSVGYGTPGFDNVDADFDGIPNRTEMMGNTDVDNDGIPNFRDLDSDNDTIGDIIEAGLTDADGDYQIDAIALRGSVVNPPDSDNDGLDDYRDLESNNPSNNGEHYDIKQTALAQLDTDGNGQVNLSDNNISPDANQNGIYDTAENYNVPPEFAANFGDITFSESQPNSYVITATDANSDAVSFTLGSAPSGMTISASGNLQWTPPETAGPGQFDVVVIATDNNANDPKSTSKTFIVNVNEVNVPPNVTAIPLQSVVQNTPWSLTINASDTDIPSQTLSVSLSGQPAGMELSDRTISWTPTALGDFSFSVRVSDGKTTGSRTVKVRVTPPSQPPVMDASHMATISERQLWTYKISAVDPENETLSYTVSGAPAGLVLDGTTGWMRWLPGTSASGTLTFTVTATDTYNLSADQQITLTVTDLPATVGGCVATNMLVAPASNWEYAVGVAGDDWKEPWADTADWTTGAGPFGYGESGLGSTLPDGFIRSVFSQTFNVSMVGEITTLTLKLRRDDGAVVYLNGEEVARDNLPAGVLSETSLASSSLFGAAERVYEEFNIPVAKLAQGINTIAVGIHQVAANSSDMVFDASLEAIRDRNCNPLAIDLAVFRATGMLKFNTEAGTLYEVQCCDNLLMGSWQTLTTMTADGSSCEFEDTSSGPVLDRVYRVKQLP